MVIGECGKDVGIELFLVHNDCSMERDGNLFLCEYQTEVARVDCSIVAISPFRIDIPSSSQRVRFGAHTTRAEADNEVELGKVLGPMSLSSGQDFSSGEIFQVLVIHDNIDWSTRTFEEVLPDMESLKYCQ